MTPRLSLYSTLVQSNWKRQVKQLQKEVIDVGLGFASAKIELFCSVEELIFVTVCVG